MMDDWGVFLAIRASLFLILCTLSMGCFCWHVYEPQFSDLHGYHMQQLQRLFNCSYVIPCGDAPQGAQGEGGH